MHAPKVVKTVTKYLTLLTNSGNLPEAQEQNLTNVRVIHVIGRLFPHSGVPENPSTVLSLMAVWVARGRPACCDILNPMWDPEQSTALSVLLVGAWYTLGLTAF